MVPANQAKERADPAATEVVYPNFKRRLSGVTTSMTRLVPVLRSLGLGVAALGPLLPAETARLKAHDLLRFWRSPTKRPKRIWHARRNVEMIAGIILRDVARMPLRLVFTSASQREHKPTTRWMIRRMDAVVATSEKSKAFLRVPATVVSHGIDLTEFRPTTDHAAEKQALGLDPTMFHIGCFGRVRPQKGTDLFVDALIPILTAHQDWCGLISGRVTSTDQTFADALDRRIAEAGLSGRLRFIGERPSIIEWFRALDLFVAPARWEGFGLTPLEAMASGVPVVATDVGVFSELIVEGVTGTIVREQTPAALGAAISRFVEHDAFRRGAAMAARRYVEEHYSLEREARGLIAVYDRLAPPRD